MTKIKNLLRTSKEAYKAGREGLVRPTSGIVEKVAHGAGTLATKSYDSAVTASVIAYELDKAARIERATQLAVGHNADLLTVVSNLAETGLYTGINAPSGFGTKRDMRGNIRSERDSWIFIMDRNGQSIGATAGAPIYLGSKFNGQDYGSAYISIVHDGLQGPQGGESVHSSVILHNDGELNLGATKFDIASDGTVFINDVLAKESQAPLVKAVFDGFLHDSSPKTQKIIVEEHKTKK